MKIFNTILSVLTLNFLVCTFVIANNSILPTDDIKSFKQFLIDGVDVNATNQYGETMLHLAAKKGNFKMVRFLLKHGAKQEIADNNGIYPVSVAGTERDQRIGEQKSFFSTKWASDHEKYNKIVHLFIKDSFRKREKLSNARLLEQAKKLPPPKPTFYMPIDDIEFLKQLIASGIDVNATNKYGDTMLHLAAKKGDAGMVRLLLGNKAEPNMPNCFGVYPMNFATNRGFKEIIDLLHSYGASYCDVDVEEKIELPKSQLLDKIGILTFRGPDFYMPINDIDSLKKLLADGVDVNAINMYGETMLHLATQLENVAMVTLLLEHGARSNATNHMRLGPIDYAYSTGNKEMIRLFPHDCPYTSAKRDSSYCCLMRSYTLERLSFKTSYTLERVSSKIQSRQPIKCIKLIPKYISNIF